MKLLLDIGNTRIKSALLNDDHKLTQHQAIVHQRLDADQLQSQFLQQYSNVRAVWVANVAGTAMAMRIHQAVTQQWQLHPLFAVTDSSRGAVINAYPQPEKLGVDRWLSLLATHAMRNSLPSNFTKENSVHSEFIEQVSKTTAHGITTLIVSIGTAMTLDVLSVNGQHRGGLIVPGPDLMINSLMKNTSDIATHAAVGEESDKFFADNTQGAIYQGANLACAAIIESAYKQLSATESTQVILTGGAAERVVPLLAMPFQAVPDLVLQGLAVIAQG